MFSAFTRKLHSRCAIHGLFMRCRSPWGQTPLEPNFMQETWRNYCEYRFQVVWDWKAKGSLSLPRRRICLASCTTERIVDCFWNVMAHAQKPDFVFRRNGRVHLNRRGRQFSRLLVGGVHISGSNAGCTMFRGSVRVLATHFIRQFPLHFHFPSLRHRMPSHFNWTLFDTKERGLYG